MEQLAVNAQTTLQKTWQSLEHYLNQTVIGQPTLIKKILIALLADGHILVEGAPGLAKTRVIKSLANLIEGDFHRIQFTPDLLPGDLTGTDIYRPENGTFAFQPGPLFHHIILADEINRAPAKVQSALLEAMAERQVTIGGQTYPLPKLFLVMATQNPIEQEGTYPLPEAQLDRFLMYINIDYPSASLEKEILALSRNEASGQKSSKKTPSISQKDLFKSRQDVLNIHLSEPLEDYLITLVTATRDPGLFDMQLAKYIRFGASPRATIALDRGAKAHAWLNGRDYVTPEDIHAIVYDVLRHRILLSYEAEAEGIKTDDIVERLLTLVAIP